MLCYPSTASPHAFYDLLKSHLSSWGPLTVPALSLQRAWQHEPPRRPARPCTRRCAATVAALYGLTSKSQKSSHSAAKGVGLLLHLAVQQTPGARRLRL